VTAVNVAELAHIVAESDQSTGFSIRSVAAPDLLPNDVYVLEPSVDHPGKWVVYYTERGQVSPLGLFDDEESACARAYGLFREIVEST